MHDCKDIVKVLLEHEFDINEPTSDGLTPLHLGNKNIFLQLINHLLF